MNTKSTDLEYLSSIFKVLSDPTRLKLFSMLLSGVHCNCELGGITGLPNNLISHHMHVLIKAGLIHSQRKPDDARWILYSVDYEQLGQLQQVLTEFANPVNSSKREPICPPCNQS
jgi:ArsR family transcriptional regulator